MSRRPVVIVISNSTTPHRAFRNIADNISHIGYTTIHYVTYRSASSFTDAVLHVRDAINNIIRDMGQKIILIGYSYGGFIANNLAQFGWNIVDAIYIASPLTGTAVSDSILREHFTWNTSHDQNFRNFRDIVYINRSVPLHKYFCITLGLFEFASDGFVKMKSACFGNRHHAHVAWTSHVFGLSDPRVAQIVANHLQ